ncbi:uncharacterized protein LOC110602052 [Manihot esculenta]|uniref:uncharacterized protein LOC110602052 n=1 Tax=Manihot esculenta TaxID=3983 RepID=UPI000B5D1D66|nr:uncharacterized protein LOC110602052 [Manihot esculenta]
MVSGKGIESNLEKVEAILRMPKPTCVRDVQRLTGRVVALNIFMSKSAESCLPFFRKLRKVTNFEWTEDCQQAFRNLKQYLSSPHVLSSLIAGEELLIYLAASEQAISTVLVREEEGEQKPVFYVSKVLRDAKVKYLNIEKLAYALLLTVRKFRVYLESHQGVVLTDQPLKKILHKLETSGWMLTWSIEISPYYPEYRPRTAIKAQALADFIAECSFNEERTKLSEKPAKAMEIEHNEQLSRKFSWSLFVDGASSIEGNGAGVMLKGPGGFKVCYALWLEFNATNNVADYEALINGMLIAMEVGATDLEINSDSQLVINQVIGTYQARDLTMQKYLAKVKAIEAELGEQGIIVKYQRIPREENEEADLLSRLSEEELEQLPHEVEEGQSWMTPYLKYLEKEKLPEDKAKAKKIAVRAANYQAIRGTLYKRGKSSPWIRCVGPEEAARIIEEIHQGICGAHEGAGILWPEAETVPTIRARKMIDWSNIICRFGVPRVLISDNSKQLNFKTFKEFTRNMGIWHKFSLVAHPQTNGQIEVTNRAILQGLKKRLDGANRNWTDELNSILSALRTTPRTPTKETPFTLAFGTKALVPVELQVPTHRVQFNSKDTNNDKLRSNLDTLEEIREEAQLRTAAYQHTTKESERGA